MRVPEVDAILGTTDFPQIVSTIDGIIEPQKSTSTPLA
jgi:hypothetical protein